LTIELIEKGGRTATPFTFQLSADGYRSAIPVPIAVHVGLAARRLLLATAVIVLTRGSALLVLLAVYRALALLILVGPLATLAALVLPTLALSALGALLVLALALELALTLLVLLAVGILAHIALAVAVAAALAILAHDMFLLIAPWKQGTSKERARSNPVPIVPASI